jgi:hypothetical protein
MMQASRHVTISKAKFIKLKYEKVNVNKASIRFYDDVPKYTVKANRCSASLFLHIKLRDKPR